MKYQDKQHFSHNHVLNPLQLDQGDNITCKACDQNVTDPSLHGCIRCNYYLYDSCLNTPRSLLHSSHPSHPLTLHPTPTYPTYSFTCNACHSLGNKFSLSCAHCDYDIHIQCANLPDFVLVEEKHPHEMKLKFRSPYDDKTPFKCGVCTTVMNPDQWLYICETCGFGSHLDCINARPRPKQMPNDDSVPATSAQQPPYYQQHPPNDDSTATSDQQPQQPPYYQQQPPHYSMYPGAQYPPPQTHNMNTTNQVPGAQFPPPQMPNVNTTNQAHQQAMDAMTAANKAQEEIDVAHAYYSLQAKGRRVALDLIDDRRRYNYY